MQKLFLGEKKIEFCFAVCISITYIPNSAKCDRQTWVRLERRFWNVLILIEISIVVVDSLWIRRGTSAAVF